MMNNITIDDIEDIKKNLYLPNNYSSIDIINNFDILPYYNITITNEKYGNMNNLFVGTYNDNDNIIKVFIKLYLIYDINYILETSILEKNPNNIFIKKGNIVECDLSYIIYNYIEEKTKIITMLDNNGFNFIYNQNVAFIFNMFNIISGYYFYPIILGKGSYGVNYLAHYIEKNKNIAVKLIYKHNDDILTFDKEVFILKKFTLNNTCHTNILCYISSGYINNINILYISTEYIDGSNLTNLIENNYNFNLKTKYNIMLQLAQTLKYIHSLDILHLDIKPDNIIYDIQNNNAYIIDFGLSCFYKKDTIYIDYKCNNNTAPGTPLFMSPELLIKKYKFSNSKDVFNPSNDIYSLGILFIYLLTGKILFKVTSEQKRNNNRLPLLYMKYEHEIFMNNVKIHNLYLLDQIQNINIKFMLINMISYHPKYRINIDKVIDILNTNLLSL